MPRPKAGTQLVSVWWSNCPAPGPMILIIMLSCLSCESIILFSSPQFLSDFSDYLYLLFMVLFFLLLLKYSCSSSDRCSESKSGQWNSQVAPKTSVPGGHPPHPPGTGTGMDFAVGWSYVIWHSWSYEREIMLVSLPTSHELSEGRGFSEPISGGEVREMHLVAWKKATCFFILWTVCVEGWLGRAELSPQPTADRKMGLSVLQLLGY